MKIVVDGEKCQGHGRCYALAPDLFEFDENGYALSSDNDIPEDRLDDVKLAAANCPEGAITIA
jgi:ferredoxin